MTEQIAEGDSWCWLWDIGPCPSLEPARLRGLLNMRRRLEVISTGCRKTGMHGTELPVKVTVDGMLWMDLEGD